MTNIAKRDQRIRNLAELLCVEWFSGKTRLEKYDGKWWLVGCPGGDTALPNTRGCRDIDSALDAVESWLASFKV